MPSTVKVRVQEARNLPLSGTDKLGGLPISKLSNIPDAYVTVSLGGNQTLQHISETSAIFSARTKVCRKTQSPYFGEEFRFDVSDDTLLQDEPLIFKVWNSLDYKQDELIGLVYADLNPILNTTADTVDGGIIEGWFPLYDTLAGVRGEVRLSVKLNFIGDVNPFRDSSAGVRLLPVSTIDKASGWKVSHVFGFVEELVVADDPEFEWEEAQPHEVWSQQHHETRQTLLYLLDASVRRRMSKTVLEMGGNAVLGYHQNFDVEGDSGIVARTYGTCVLLERAEDGSNTDKLADLGRLMNSAQSAEELAQTLRDSRYLLEPGRLRDNVESDVQLLTMRDFDPSVRIRIGGLVTARSVKYLGNLASKLSDQETRDS